MDRSVQSGELGTVTADGRRGLPSGLWRGLEFAALDETIKQLDLSKLSPAVRELWVRALMSETTPPRGAQADGQFELLRIEALLQMGMVSDVLRLTEQARSVALRTLRSLALLARGEKVQACQKARAMIRRLGAAQDDTLGHTFVLAAYCAAGDDSVEAGVLVADMARERRLDAPVPYGILDAMAAGARR
ncbi:MAG: hypothetical protein V3V97_10205, partial [Hyphomicrobiaceae bacterium]